MGDGRGDRVPYIRAMKHKQGLPMRKRLAAGLAVGIVSVLPAAPASAQQQTGCYAEVWYTGQTHGHTYEYLCGSLKLHVGQTVRVPVRTSMSTARIVRISHYRTYFG